MSMTVPRHVSLPSPKEIKQALPLREESFNFIQESRAAIQNILTKQDKRLLVILGPCSIHDVEGAKEYAYHLKDLSVKVASQLFLCMRVHVEKPRTTLGWKGLLHDPFIDGSNDMNSGLKLARSLLLDLASMGVPAGMEFLELMSSNYLSDLISWGSIGARTSSSQPHRQLASSLPMPVGFKNATDGNLTVAVQGALAAQFPHSFMNIDDEGRICTVHSEGNTYAHIVLRGSQSRSNYDEQSIRFALGLLETSGVRKELLIDCSHGNAYKDYMKQKGVFDSVINQVIDGNEHIVGTMLESHLQGGSQAHSGKLSPFISLTDPCLDWQTTEELLLQAHEKLLSQKLQLVN